MKTARSGSLLALVIFICLIASSIVADAQDSVANRHGLASITPAEAGINKDALDALIKRAEELHSDSLVILKDGKLAGEWYFNKPRGTIEAMSVTKSIVNIAIGRLVTAGKIKSMDEPVYTFYPEWKQGRKQQVTLRHLLNHTSGLQTAPTTEEIYASPDFVKLALAAELASDPGAKFFYNNKSTNLLAGIVKIVSGKRMDEYLKDEIFTPLGIKDFSWTLDKAGNPHGMSGLQIHAVDLAKLGQLMLNEGVWGGNQLLSKEWVAESTKAGQAYNETYGLMWWRESAWTKVVVDDERIDQWKKGGINAEMLDRVAMLKGKQFEREEYINALRTALGGDHGLDNWRKALAEKGLPGARSVMGPIIGYSGNGYLGQFVVVLPGSKIVAVRQIRYNSHKTEADSFMDFSKMVKALVSTN